MLLFSSCVKRKLFVEQRQAVLVNGTKQRTGSAKCGSLAQLVEQRPEEPCVPSSSLGGATKKKY